MNILSRRKRLLNQTLKAPKMSSRRQFHRALRRHPAWPAVMAEAAARAELHKQEAAARAQAQKDAQRGSRNAMAPGYVSSRSQLRRNLRRNRALLVALLAVGGLVAVLNGIGAAQYGTWNPHLSSAGADLGNTPSPRFGMASAFDPVNDEIVIFGGFGLKGTETSANLDETWAYKAGQARWINRNPVHKPSPRGFASMAYDEARKNVVLFGGAPYRSNVNAASAETWTWDGKNWIKQEPPDPRPPARKNAVMVYDAHRKVIVLFGGLSVEGIDVLALNDTWTWDGSRWQIMSSAGAPSPRHSAAMAYDACRAQAVMFGGVRHPLPPTGGFAPESQQTWVWNGTSWKESSPELPNISPTARIGASMVYSPRTGHVLMYGGLSTADTGHSSAATYEHLWVWDGDAWRAQTGDSAEAALNSTGNLSPTPPSGPPPRAYATWTFDSIHRSVEYKGGIHLFGGTPSLDTTSAIRLLTTPQVPLGDQWSFKEPEWRLAGNDAIEALLQGPFGCPNPVPIPTEGAPVVDGSKDPEPAKVSTSNEVREIGKLPVLVGTDWPGANRDTHFYPKTPNPNYTPAPDCPNRSANNATSGNTETGSNTHLVTDPKRNRVYQFFICDPNRGSGYNQQNNTYQTHPAVGRLKIQAYDGTTLKPLGSVITPISITITAGGSQIFLGDMLLHDAGRGQFLIRSSYYSGSTTVNELVFVQQNLIEKGVDPILRKVPLAGSILKMSFFDHPKTGQPKLLINRGGTSLSQIDLESNTPDWNATWDGAATGCASMGSDVYTSNMSPVRFGNRVYNACSGAGRGGIVRVTTTENADGSEAPGTVEVFLGPVGVSGNWDDPAAERMLLLSQTRDGATLWVFDGKASRYVGRAGIHSAGIGGASADSRMQFGLDRETGRLYGHMQDDVNNFSGKKIQGGLLMVDSRLTPIPQALKFPHLASLPAVPIATLPPEPGRPRRVFIRRMGGDMRKYPDGETLKMPNEIFYTILADEVLIPGAAELAQLDALTIPVAESPGKTEVSFEAEGSGYGIRLRSVGGIWSALRAPQQAYNSLFLEAVDDVALSTGRPYFPSCLLPDRELMMGWVPQAHLSDLDAAVRSTGLDVDSNSKTDLEGPFSRCTPPATPADLPPTGKPVFDALWPLKDTAVFQANTAVGPNLKWDKHFHEVECVGDASNVTQTTGADISGSANCNQKQGRVDGVAHGALGAAATNAVFSVGEGHSTVTVARDPVKGVVVTSTAVATGIKSPEITIGYVKTEAVAWSNGRPGEGRASFTRTICRVQIPKFEQQQPYKDNACLNKTQQEELVARWNSGWGINSKMFLPKYDPELYQGSPGGYIAGVIKPAADEIEDQIFAKDFQREVPGLVIEFYKDTLTQGPGRQVLQLAATRAVAGLGVQCNSDLIYSPSSKNCVALTFEDDAVVEEFFEEEEASSDDSAFNSYDEDSGGWTPIEATGASEGLALGTRLGRFIENLPVLRRLPIRQMGEALLAASVWFLFFFRRYLFPDDLP